MNERYSDYLRKEANFLNTCTLIAAFRKAMAFAPDKVALFSAEHSYTFRDLERMSNQLARALDRIGIQPGDFVAVMSGRSIETIVAILGVWKAGCAYVFLDRDYPVKRNLECMKECGARLILTTQFIDDAIENMDSEDFLDRSTREGVAVIVYTSGTTSRPKGVLLTHRNIVASISNFTELDIHSDDVYCCFANLMFVASVYDISLCICIGCTLTLMPKELRRSISGIAEFYVQNKITVSFLPPHMAKKYQAYDVGSPLRVLICGSEPVRNLNKRSYKIAHVYASSEACAVVSHYWIEDERTSYPIGKPVANIKCYIVDEDGHEVKNGDEGELWISGPQVTHGYLDEPEANRKHFHENPFTTEEGFQTVYRTGDIVSLDADGNLICHGRADGMVKVRGFRIELSAVEATILKFPGIDEVKCEVFRDKGGENILFGYYTSKAEIDHGELRQFIGRSIPYYMIPTGLVRVEQFERNLNGKIVQHQFQMPAYIDDHKKCAQLYY